MNRLIIIISLIYASRFNVCIYRLCTAVWFIYTRGFLRCKGGLMDNFIHMDGFGTDGWFMHASIIWFKITNIIDLCVNTLI